jgi:hypothetical protein
VCYAVEGSLTLGVGLQTRTDGAWARQYKALFGYLQEGV